MPGPFDICSGSLHKSAMKFVQQFRALRKIGISRWRRRKPRRLFSDFNLLTSPSSSSFAAMEVSNQLKQVFKYFDANGDGKISPTELSEVLLSLRQHDDKSTATKEAEGMVRAMDRDGDGLVDMEEFMRAMMNIDDDDDEQHHNASTAAAEENDLMDAFHIFDSDKNGLISAEELRRVFVNLGYQDCTLRECREMIKGVDKDGDGFVDFKEFRSMMASAGCIS